MLKRFKKIYEDSSDELFKELSLNNIHQIPKLLKIVINMGLGKSIKHSSKVIDNAVSDLTLISGQKPVVTLAKKSIAGFSIRKGMKIGCKVTLRRSKMYEFLERLVIVALPRVKDFKGLSKNNFDGKGNCNFGIPEQIAFPEIEYDKVDHIRGMNITIVTSTDNDLHAKKVLEKLNIPFNY